MKRKPLLITTMVVFAVLAMSRLALTEPRAAQSESGGAYSQEIEMHFRYYEQIRPTLLGGDNRVVTAVCDDTNTFSMQSARK